jgi:hypothetical protein
MLCLFKKIKRIVKKLAMDRFLSLLAFATVHVSFKPEQHLILKRLVFVGVVANMYILSIWNEKESLRAYGHHARHEQKYEGRRSNRVTTKEHDDREERDDRCAMKERGPAAPRARD